MPPAAWRRMLFFLAEIIHISMGNNNANGLYAFFWPKMAKNGQKLVFFSLFRGGLTCSDLAEILHTGSSGEVFRGEFSSRGRKVKNGRVMAKNAKSCQKVAKSRQNGQKWSD